MKTSCRLDGTTSKRVGAMPPLSAPRVEILRFPLDASLRASYNDSMKCNAYLKGCWGKCERNATVERYGKHYCWQHDPGTEEKNREKRLKKRAEEQAKIDEWERKRDLRIAAGINSLTDDDLRVIVSLGGIKVMISLLTEKRS